MISEVGYKTESKKGTNKTKEFTDTDNRMVATRAKGVGGSKGQKGSNTW